MKQRIEFFSAFILTLLFTSSPALSLPAQKIKFEHISLEQGLSQSVVNCILQDRKGFMWFGTLDGLNKYDGYGFTVYKYDPADSNSLSDNTILAIYEDSFGMLWIGTRNGLNKFDRRKEKFTRYQNHPARSTSLRHNTVTSICEDRKRAGKLWIGTSGGGLDLFDVEKEEFSHYQNDPANPNSLSNNRVQSICQDRAGTLWVGTYDGLNRIAFGENDGVGEFIHFKHDPQNPNSLSHDRIAAVYEDRAGNLWITTIGGGVNKFDREKEQFTRYTYNPADPNSLGHNTVRPICEDQSGRLWIGTSGGIDQFDRERERFAHHKNDPADPNSLSNNDVWSIYEDHSGTLWVGTYGGGLNKFSREKEKFVHIKNDPNDSNSLGHNMVMSLCQDHTGTLWVGTGGGGLFALISRGGGEREKFIQYRYKPNDAHSLSNDGVAAIYEDKSGALWIGTGEGLNRLDRKKKRFIRYQHDPANPKSLSARGVSAICEDDAGALWIGTGIGGLNKFDKKKRQFTRYQHDPANPKSLSDNMVYALFFDNTGRLWIGTAAGLNQFDKNKEEFIHYRHDPANPQSLSNDRVFSIYADPDSAESVLWVGTWGGGLNRFDRKNGTFTHFTEKDGLPNDVIYGILGDGEGNLWLSTNKGLSKFNPRTRTFRNYDVEDGLQSNEFNQGAHAKSKSGEMFFGGINGLNRFYPDRVKDNPHIPPLALTAFKKFDKIAALNTAISEIKRITLSHQDDFFAFTFAALDFTNPKKNQYAYMLEGFDKEWIYCGTRRYASYTSLDGGEYRFRVKGSNNDGVWNEEGVSVKIIINPPFWKRWWFLTLSVLSLAFAGYRVYRQRLEAKLQKARIVNELRTAHDMQMKLMPSSAPLVEGFDISGICKPAEEVGGDYFDYLWLDDRKTKLGIVIVDVSGKAMKGAMMAVMTSGMVKIETGNSQSPRLILQKINKALYNKADQSVFTAMLFSVIDTRNQTITFSNAGQTQPMLKRNDAIHYLEAKGARFPLGVQPEVEYKEVTHKLRSGDIVILYTDGLPETMNAAQELFDLERMERAIRELPSQIGAAEIVERLITEVEKFSGHARPHDDMTLVVVRVI